MLSAREKTRMGLGVRQDLDEGDEYPGDAVEMADLDRLREMATSMGGREANCLTSAIRELVELRAYVERQRTPSPAIRCAATVDAINDVSVRLVVAPGSVGFDAANGWLIVQTARGMEASVRRSMMQKLGVEGGVRLTLEVAP